MAKKPERRSEALCEEQCPTCKAKPGCLKNWSHILTSKHLCFNCGNQW